MWVKWWRNRRGEWCFQRKKMTWPSWGGKRKPSFWTPGPRAALSLRANSHIWLRQHLCEGLEAWVRGQGHIIDSHVEGHRGWNTVNRNDLWEVTLGLPFTLQLTRLAAAWSGVSMGQGPGHHCSDFPAISSLHPSMPSPTRFKSRPYFMLLLWQAFLDFTSWVRGPSDSHRGVLKLSVSLSLPLDCGPPEGKDHVSIVPVLSTLTGKGGVLDVCWIAKWMNELVYTRRIPPDSPDNGNVPST